MITTLDVLGIVLVIPIISYLDYHLIGRHLQCLKCGYREMDWRYYLLPVTLEFLFFIGGIAVGLLAK